MLELEILGLFLLFFILKKYERVLGLYIERNAMFTTFLQNFHLTLGGPHVGLPDGGNAK